MAANWAFFAIFEDLIVTARAKNKDMAVFALTYTLSSQGQYPTQLRQAVEAVRYVQQRHRPEAIVLGGDSAGGSLAMGVASHLAHPHPAIEPIHLSRPLAGVVLVSPPPSMDEEVARSQEVYYGGDILVPDVALGWLRLYLGGGKRDFYTDPYDAPQDWFKDLPVSKMLVLAGGNEVLRPLIEDFVEKVKVRRDTPTPVVQNRADQL